MTDSSSESDRFGSPGVIAGVAAASVLLLALVLVALYLNHHSTSASPFYLIQVSNGLSHIRVDIKLNTNRLFVFLHPWFPIATQESLAFVEVSETTARLLRSGGKSPKRQYC